MRPWKTMGIGVLVLMMAGAGWAFVADAGSTAATEVLSIPIGTTFESVVADLVPSTQGWGCPASSAFTCSEDCFAQRQSCIANCGGIGGGDFDCIGICVRCYRDCVFTCGQ